MPCLPPEPRKALKESEGESEGSNESAAWDVGSLVGGLWGLQRLRGLGGQSCPGVCFYFSLGCISTQSWLWLRGPRPINFFGASIVLGARNLKVVWVL